VSWLAAFGTALVLALAPVLLGIPGFTLFGAGCLVLGFAAIRADSSKRKLRVATLFGAFALLFLLYYLPALLHEF
jgi:hypothetical protein